MLRALLNPGRTTLAADENPAPTKGTGDSRP
jgi:hypothetical protein